MCPKEVCVYLQDPEEIGDGTYAVLKGIKNVLKWVTNIWPPLMGSGSSGTPKFVILGQNGMSTFKSQTP